ncbi:MAG: replication-relaxation family protein [Thermoanaerobaculia bacterium]|nr:replication-relaxation family protein [Thermoanaerobaculia bacterium]
MLPGDRAHPLQLVRGKAPAFLAHQREVNKLCIGFQATFGEHLQWASAFDRPFPNTIGGIVMPQPDFTLVIQTATGSQLVFGEHDRGSESLAHFRRAKVERYAELADLPAFCRDTFGFATFRVVVTVVDAVKQKPRARIATLANCAQQSAAQTNMRFELAGITHATPDSLFGSDAESQRQEP